MAILEKIRNKSGLVIGVVGFALFAFIIGDLFNSGKNPFSSSDLVGKIDGESITYNQFLSKTKKIQELYTNTTMNQAINSTWAEFEKEFLLEKEFEKLGLSASNYTVYKELSKNPQIQNEPAFKDADGNFDISKVEEYSNTIKSNPSQNKSWANYEEYIRKNIPSQMYVELIKKGLFASIKESELEYKFDTEKLDADYVLIPYSSIEEADITNEELLKYVNENKLEKDYKSKGSISIQYINIDVKPSEEDLNLALSSLNNLLEERKEYDKEKKEDVLVEGFKNTKKDSSFIVEYSDGSYDENFYHKFENTDLNNWVKNANKGDIYGPYKENDSYKVAKLHQIRVIPDSVEAKHILISYKDLGISESITRDKESAKKLIDSIFNLIKKDRTIFENLAKEFSDDKNDQNPGFLGWFTYGKMVKPFNNFCFNTGKKGDLKIVETQFGYHIIEIINQKNIGTAYQLAILEKKIYTSQTTDDLIYEKLSKLSSKKYSNLEEFRGFASELNLESKTFESESVLDYSITGIEGEQRNVIKWCYDKNVKIGDTKLFDINNGYMVVYIYGKQEKDSWNYEKMNRELREKVSIQKKSKIIIDKCKNLDTQNLENIAKEFSLEVNNLLSVAFNNSFIANVGSEPKVVGGLFGLAENKVSYPTTGNKGVFFFKLKQKNLSSNIESYLPYKLRLENNYKMSIYEFYILQNLKNNVKIEDNRELFF